MRRSKREAEERLGQRILGGPAEATGFEFICPRCSSQVVYSGWGWLFFKKIKRTCSNELCPMHGLNIPIDQLEIKWIKDNAEERG